MERNEVDLLKRERSEQVGGEGYVFGTDLFTQGMVHAVISRWVVWKGELKKISRKVLLYDKIIIFAGDSEAKFCVVVSDSYKQMPGVLMGNKGKW